METIKFEDLIKDPETIAVVGGTIACIYAGKKRTIG